MKKTLSALLAVMMLFMLCACGDTNSAPYTTVPSQTASTPTQESTAEPTEPEEPEMPKVPLEAVKEENFANYKYVLTEVASFKDHNGAGVWGFSTDLPVLRTDLDQLYSYTGELMIEEGCENYDYFGDGRTAMYTEEKTRFVNVYTGEVYFEDTEIVRVIELNDRYYFAVFADYGKVYDMETEDYIDGLKVTDLSVSGKPQAIGDTVFERIDHRKYRVYMGDGTVYGEIDNVIFTEIGFIRELSEGVEVYNEKCELLAVLDNARASMEFGTSLSNLYSWKYYKVGEYKNFTVVDINGKQVIPDYYESVNICGDYIYVTDSNSLKGMYLADGTKILDCEYAEIFYSTEAGVFTMTTEDGEKKIYVPGCGIWDLGELTLSGKVVEDYNGSYLLFALGETLKLENANEVLGTNIVKCDRGLVEVYNGTTIMEPDYDFVAATTEYLYVLRGETWHVYSYELVTK